MKKGNGYEGNPTPTFREFLKSVVLAAFQKRKWGQTEDL